MKKVLVTLFMLLLIVPTYAQDTPVEAIPVCNENERLLIPRLLVDSGFLLDYALVSFSSPTDDGTIDYMPSIVQMLAVRDVWVEAIKPNLPNCVQSVNLQILMGDFLDQSLIQMLTSTVNDPMSEGFAYREDVEMARVQGFDLEIGLMFETIFVDMDIETILREQMEARDIDG
jgi:hypothetical protein